MNEMASKRRLAKASTGHREALFGVICRCTGYVKPIAAVLTAAQEMRQGKVEAAA